MDGEVQVDQPRIPRHRGEAVQVDPITHALKAPESKLCKHEKLLSRLAFSFNLRRYAEAAAAAAYDNYIKDGVVPVR